MLKNKAVIVWKYSSFTNGKPLNFFYVNGKTFTLKIFVRNHVVNQLFRVFVKCLYEVMLVSTNAWRICIGNRKNEYNI